MWCDQWCGGVKKIIYISSAAASLHGGGYSRSKLEAEKRIIESGMQWVILRPSEVYGQRAGDSINQLIHWIQSYFFVPVIGFGTYKLSPVFIDDVVPAMALAIFNKELENKTISCKDVDFRVLGFSLATINTLISVLISVIIIKILINYEKNK